MKTYILSIPLFEGNISAAINSNVFPLVDSRENRCISATGAHGLVHAKRNPEFAKTLKSFYLNLPDGMPSVWIGRLKGAKRMQRCYGPDFFEALIRASSDKPIYHFFCGGKPGVAAELKDVCEKKYGNHNVVGVCSPPFREMTDGEMLNLSGQISLSKANIVWIGLSTPKQEVFACRLAMVANVDFIMTIGAAFDFHTGKIEQAPRWIQNCGLEWFFRLISEPKRLSKRYFEIVPLFLYYNFIELVKYIFRFLNK